MYPVETSCDIVNIFKVDCGRLDYSNLLNGYQRFE
jgi:hypothetical protein